MREAWAGDFVKPHPDLACGIEQLKTAGQRSSAASDRAEAAADRADGGLFAGDPEEMVLSPLVSAVDDMAQRGNLRMWPRPPVPGSTDLILIAGQDVHDIVSGSMSLRDGLLTAPRRDGQYSPACLA